MKLDELTHVLERRPFEPFMIRMCDGSSYTVKHPDQVILTPRAAYVGIGGNGRRPVAQDVMICSLGHITRLGPVPKPTKKQTVVTCPFQGPKGCRVLSVVPRTAGFEIRL